MEGLLVDAGTLGSKRRRRSSRNRSVSRISDESLERSTRSALPVQSSPTTPRDIKHLDPEHSPSTAKRNLRKRTNEGSKVIPHDLMYGAMKPLTNEERRAWKGWVELESDPALFNFMLREYGVKDVKVQEVLSLDDEMLAMLPKPVYGLIFLFKYRNDEEEDDADIEKCPNNVWFANQTTNNACATIALLNIVMNVPEIDLGNAISSFKSSTRRLKPAYRGQKLSGDDFIRNVHNSFARRMDILNADLSVLNEVEKSRRARKAPKRKGPKSKPKKDEEESGFHFIAYVPINDAVWRLDGLQRQPVNLGEYGDDWMTVARANIDQRIGQYDDDGLQFNLLSVCKSPLSTIPKKLAQSIHSILAVEGQLTTILPGWKEFAEVDVSNLLGDAMESIDLPRELMDNAESPESTIRKLAEARSDPSVLLDLHRDWMREQTELRGSYVEEAALIGQENGQAARRKHDYTPMIYNAVKSLAEKGLLKEIVKDLRAKV